MTICNSVLLLILGLLVFLLKIKINTVVQVHYTKIHFRYSPTNTLIYSTYHVSVPLSSCYSLLKSTEILPSSRITTQLGCIFKASSFQSDLGFIVTTKRKALLLFRSPPDLWWGKKGDTFCSRTSLGVHSNKILRKTLCFSKSYARFDPEINHQAARLK